MQQPMGVMFIAETSPEWTTKISSQMKTTKSDEYNEANE